MFVALRRHSFTRNGCNSWWNNDRRFRVTLGNGVIGDLAVIRPICRQRRNVSVDLIKQVWQFGDVTDIIQGQFHGDDFMCIGIDTEMQLAPSSARTNAVLLVEPFALAVNLQSVLSTSRCSGSLRSTRFGKIVRPPLRRLIVV